MGMGRKRWRQESSWVAIRELPRTKGHVFYDWVNGIFEEHGFDKFAEWCFRHQVLAASP